MSAYVSIASTDTVDPDDRVAFWEDYNARQLVALRCMTYQDSGLRARETNLDLGAIRVAEIVGNPHVIERSREHVNETPKGSIFLTHLISGTAFFVHADGCLRLNAGDTVVYDASRPYLFGFETQMHQVLLDLPHEVLPALGRSHTLLAGGTAVTVGGSRSRALAQLMQAVLADSGPGASTTSRSRVDAEALLAAAISVIAPRDAPAAALVNAAVAEVRRRLADPALSIEVVARAVGVSPRHLNRLFASDGCTVTQFIQRERIEAARRDLGDPACGHLRVVDIAARWGFSSQAHFTRAFRRVLGVTPSEARESSSPPDGTVRGTV